jgi:hypothetical protein
VLTIDSPPLVVIVRKLLPFPMLRAVYVTGASGVPLLETARTVMVEAPPVQLAHCPPMNGLIMRSPYVIAFAREIVRLVKGVPSGFADTRACPEDGSNRFWVEEKSTVTFGKALREPVTRVPVPPEFNKMLTSLDGLFPGVKMMLAFIANGDSNANRQVQSDFN